jgi:predicted Zn-dependent peptidase
MGMEQASARCEQMAAQYLTYGRLIDTHELIVKINAIDAKAVSRTAGKILASGPLSIAAMGPMGNLGSYDRIVQRFQ